MLQLWKLLGLVLVKTPGLMAWHNAIWAEMSSHIGPNVFIFPALAIMQLQLDLFLKVDKSKWNALCWP